jgi:hypothetical protein
MLLVIGFLASLEEQGLGREPFTTARMTTSSVMFGVHARRWMNLH